MVVSPTADNVHEFTALAPTALFDVIAPPYDDACGRSCSYYRYGSTVALVYAEAAWAHPC